MDNCLYVFIARNTEEFKKYPDEKYGYSELRNLRVPYRYKGISETDTIVVLDDFQEKNLLKNLDRVCDEDLKFLFALATLLEQISTNHKIARPNAVNVMIHLGGLDWDKTCDGVGKTSKVLMILSHRDNGWFQKLGQFENKELREYIAGFAADHLLNYHCYPISSEDPNPLVDLTVAQIRLPDSEDELRSFDGRLKLRDVSRVAIDKKIKDYYRKRNKLGSKKKSSSASSPKKTTHSKKAAKGGLAARRKG